MICGKWLFAWLFTTQGRNYARIVYGHERRVPRTLSDVTRPHRAGRGVRGDMVIAVGQAAKPVRAIGDFFAMSLDTFMA
ncbi:hypothetical protein, partial [Burkholderia multivorans]|uniref:hypothetical protein n=1 Tax=Burkholderia multivorans TaxID=87883 RepID=UPI001C65A90D